MKQLSSVHSRLAVFGFGVQCALFAVMLAESLSAPQRAAPAVRAVVILGLVVGSACVLLGTLRERAGREVRP